MKPKRMIPAIIVCATLVAGPLLSFAPPQAPGVDTVKSQVRQWHAASADIQVKLGERTLKGSIVRVDADSFTLRPKDSAQEVSVPYAQVTQIKKSGRGAKVLIIPAVIVGGAVLVLCAAPYPIGFLCRRDPS